MDYNSIKKSNDINYKRKYLKYKSKYLNLKGGNDSLPSHPMNQRSYRKAIERDYQNNENLVLIIGSGNDQRFDNMQGFTLTDELEPDETFEEDKDMLPLKYNIFDKDFFNDFKDFKFNKIIFDYNVMYFIIINMRFTSSVKLFLSTIIKILKIGGELYIPINFNHSTSTYITKRSNLSNNINLDEVNKSYVVNNSNYDQVSLSRNNYRIIIDGKFYIDKTPYLTYLNYIKDNLNHNFGSEIDQNEIKLDFYIDQRYIDYFNSNFLMEKIPVYDPNDTSFTYESYPIEPRLIDEFTGDIKEYVKITRLQ